MSTTETAPTYRRYLALTAIEKAMARAEVNIAYVAQTPKVGDPTIFDAVLSGEREWEPGLYFGGGIYSASSLDVRPDTWSKAHPQPDRYWSLEKLSREDAEQAANERNLFATLKELPGRSVVIRRDGQASIIGELHGVRYEISFGRALCQRVQTGTRIVEKPDEEAVRKATAELPMRRVEEPIYEWRCNDAELTAGVL